MTDTFYIDLSAGRVAYNAWREEFAPDWEDWDDLTGTAKAAWEEVALRVIEDRVRLPVNGIEVSFRTANGSTGLAWTGAADTEMKDMATRLLFKAMSGELA